MPSMSPREKVYMMLNALRDRIASPSDVIAMTGLPRYEVLAAFHVLEALSIIEVVYSRGNYKLYRLTKQGKVLLEALEKNLEISIEIKGRSNEETDIGTTMDLAPAGLPSEGNTEAVEASA